VYHAPDVACSTTLKRNFSSAGLATPVRVEVFTEVQLGCGLLDCDDVQFGSLTFRKNLLESSSEVVYAKYQRSSKALPDSIT
jgi:hypothetical protein